MPFAYLRPDTIAQAQALAMTGGRVLAGGQSLMPLVNRGDVHPDRLVDINRLQGLGDVQLSGDVVEIGALARLETVRLHPLTRTRLPLLAAALAWVANPAIRMRGTLVGNAVQNGPGAEAVAVLCLSGGRLVCADAAEFAIGSDLGGRFATALRIPASPPGTRAGFFELQRRFGHLGVVGAGVVQRPGRGIEVVFSGLTDRPLIAPSVGAALDKGQVDDLTLHEALAHDLDGAVPRTDGHATSRYRWDVAPVVARRALERAGIVGGGR